jgi:hypothetical protein
VRINRRGVEAIHRYIEQASDAYLITNPDGVIPESNRAAAVLLGVKSLLTPSLGGSAVWRVSPQLNLLVEIRADLQEQVTRSADNTALLGYVSCELSFK